MKKFLISAMALIFASLFACSGAIAASGDYFSVTGWRITSDKTLFAVDNNSEIGFEGESTSDGIQTYLTANASNMTGDAIITLPDRSGMVYAVKSLALTSAATISIPMGKASLWTLTPTDDQDITINDAGWAGATAGDESNFVFTSTGTNDEIITFGTNFVTTGTLTLSATAAKVMTMRFIYDGTNWCELSRTTAM